MISWLKGHVLHKWQQSSKKGIVLNVGGIGYEVQILSTQLNIIEIPNEIALWIHQINREEYTNLYGFQEISQRDLFRKIISVNGIGPQIGMALLEDNKVNDLVEAIEENDLKLLTQSQGIGKRIAERLVVDLKNKLKEFKNISELYKSCKHSKQSNNFKQYVEELLSTLNSLGYMDNEIKESIKFITMNEKTISLELNSLSAEDKSKLFDQHLKEILIRLSQKST